MSSSDIKNERKIKYTGINRLFKSRLLQAFLNRRTDSTFSDLINDWKWIFSFTRRRLGLLIPYTVFGLLTSTLSIASSYLSAQSINAITKGETDSLPLLLVFLVASFLGVILFKALQSRFQARISVSVHNDIQALMFDSIMAVRWDRLNEYKHGDLLNRFNEDVNEISNNAVSWIPDLLTNIYAFTVAFVILVRMDPVIAGLGVLSGFLLYFAARVIFKRQRAYRAKVLELNSEMMSFEAETIYNIDTVKAFGVWEHLASRFGGWQKKYQDGILSYNKFRVKTIGYLSLVDMLVTAISFLYCIFRLSQGLPFGDMSFFLDQRSTLTERVRSMVNSIPGILDAALSAHRIREVIDLPKEDYDSMVLEALKPMASRGLSIEMNNASFNYSDGPSLYEEANFCANPGEIVALLGESGGGKTTLFRLLLGLVNPGSGEVILRDADGHAAPMCAALRSFIAYVPQGNTLLLGTIAENMRMVKADATEEEIIDALKTACAWEFVEPIGLDADLGERGKGISEGQAQRISIARALLRDAPILFLDEATSALDEETEARVLDNVVKAAPIRTIIVSTHRPSVLKKCARVYRISGKRIVKED